MNSFGNDDFYLFYRKRHNGKEGHKKFVRIISLFFKKLRNELYQGNLVRFPYGLGDYYILKYKPQIKKNKDTGMYYVSGHKTIDFNETKKLWASNPEAKAQKLKIYYKNEHSDGYKIKLDRSKFSSSFLQKIYNFKPVRGFSKGMSKVMFEDPYREFLTD